MAGIDLSHPARPTKPSNRSACITVSTESVITSRDTSDARIPSCPIEMPSLTVIVPNSSGNPPAPRTPTLACSASLRSVMLHGVTSFHDDAIATCGLDQSSSPIPTARNIARDGAFCIPSVTSRDLGLTSTGVPAAFETSLMNCTVVGANRAEPGAVPTTRCQNVEMADVRETKLPGVGVRHEFTTEDGDDIGVLVHHDGRREIMIYDSDDPDKCSTLVSLSAADTRTVSELLGASRVTEAVAAVQQEIEGLAIEWIELTPDSPASGATIGDGMYRTKTGSSIVAVIRGGESIPAPGPEFPLLAGDVVVGVGTADGLAMMRELIRA
jgi:TrkA domain protein